MLALSWVTVSLRVYVRTRLIKAFGSDDWLAVATLAVFTIHSAFVFAGLQYLREEVDPNLVLYNAVEALKWWWAASLPYIICTVLVKWTFGLFLLRVGSTRIYSWTIYVVLAIITLFNFIYLFICIFQCLPVGHFWRQFEGQPGSCISRKTLTDLSYAAAALNTAGDVVLGILPIFLVRNLQLGLRTKISVAGILALGSISCLSTIIRIPYLVTLLSTGNFLAATTPVAILGLVELGLGLIATSMVTWKPLFKVWFKGERPYNYRSKGNPYIRNAGESEFADRENKMVHRKPDSEEGLAMDDLWHSNGTISRENSIK